jgi:hypothetical protein
MVPHAAGQSAAAGEAVVAWHVTLAPSWFDPSTAPPQITPFGMLYSMHDALLRPLPGQKIGNSLAEAWTESPDGLHHEERSRNDHARRDVEEWRDGLRERPGVGPRARALVGHRPPEQEERLELDLGGGRLAQWGERPPERFINRVIA